MPAPIFKPQAQTPIGLTAEDYAAQAAEQQKQQTEAGTSQRQGFTSFLGELQAPRQQATAQEQAEYEREIGRLRELSGSATTRFAPGRIAQQQAAEQLGARAADLTGGYAAQRALAQREQLAAQAGQGAILGGQIGAAMAPGMAQSIEQEAAARQQAYLRGVQQLGAGLMSEAEQRRAAESEILRDLQVRYAAAQQFAAGERERQAQQRQLFAGGLFQLGGGALAGAASSRGK